MTERDRIHSWLMAGLDAVDAEVLTREALAGRKGPLTVLAIGKAAPAMCRGAAAAVDRVDGLCVSSHEEPIPDDVELMIGDHPFPSKASLAAGRRALQVAAHADVALISGGGSSLCEVPAAGLSLDLLNEVNHALLESGVGIAEMNLVRAHLSQTKGGGLGPIATYVLSDVGGSGPEIVSSGPTIGITPDAERALSIMDRVGVPVDADLERVVRSRDKTPRPAPMVKVIGDGRRAARAVAAAVAESAPVRVQEKWLEDNYLECLTDFLRSGPGATVAAGEPSVAAEDGGRGGRNTHAALAAAQMIAGTTLCFAALATDGVDGNSGAAGAIVDGTTVNRGGDPAPALAKFDSASYLEKTGDLIQTGPTGTNVADLWLMWEPEDTPQPILTL